MYCLKVAHSVKLKNERNGTGVVTTTILQKSSTKTAARAFYVNLPKKALRRAFRTARASGLPSVLVVPHLLHILLLCGITCRQNSVLAVDSLVTGPQHGDSTEQVLLLFSNGK